MPVRSFAVPCKNGGCYSPDGTKGYYYHTTAFDGTNGLTHGTTQPIKQPGALLRELGRCKIHHELLIQQSDILCLSFVLWLDTYSIVHHPRIKQRS
jgi:hypothetical protein